MEGLAPTHRLCLEVQMAIECGEPIIFAVKKILRQCDGSLREQLSQIVFSYETANIEEVLEDKKASVLRKNLIHTICQGLSGEPILERLKDLESEIRLASEEELESYVSGLPLKALLPVLLLQFPAFLLLLFGPLLQSLQEEILR